MSDVPFHTTRMGQRFYEATLPALVREVELLNENLERLVEAVREKRENEPEEPRAEPDRETEPDSEDESKTEAEDTAP
jgi:hypothetical protein